MLIYGHRGASGYAPENTLAALGLAVKQGAHGVEFDVQLTRDGELVVCHDWTVDRTTDGTGAIGDLTLSEIKNLDAGAWFSDDFKGERIPTFEEVLDLLPETFELNVEVKRQLADQRNIEAKVVETLERYKRIDTVSVSSFNHSVIERVAKLNKTIKIGKLHDDPAIDIEKYIKENKLNIYSQNLHQDYVVKALVDRLHMEGWKIFVWTVNDLDKAKALKAVGVDVIITNYPDMMLKV